jgi:C-terminal processing protease CtpA/Prc
LPDEGSVDVAVSRYLTPSGKPLEGVGVQPDIIAPPITAADLRAGMDTHIKTALAALQNPAALAESQKSASLKNPASATTAK